mmetsp:Transcript_28908/g.52907  ORF Transcript_28908/g.52907 Transcript_28908/m.52907 type:complete len:237 (+) Transcript_28908:3220-3930(+)
MSQQVLVQACLATCLSLAIVSIRNRMDCCVSVGCDTGNSQCCSASQVCSGLEMGDFIAVLTYTMNLFAPLNFLGSIYNSVIMSMIDLRNLSELLVENPDVVDDPDAVDVPQTNADGEDVVVEFDNVRFHYPTQPETKGLKGLSFKLKKGTTTAIVGPTGEGTDTNSIYCTRARLFAALAFAPLILISFLLCRTAHIRQVKRRCPGCFSASTTSSEAPSRSTASTRDRSSRGACAPP